MPDEEIVKELVFNASSLVKRLIAWTVSLTELIFLIFATLKQIMNIFHTYIILSICN